MARKSKSFPFLFSQHCSASPESRQWRLHACDERIAIIARVERRIQWNKCASTPKISVKILHIYLWCVVIQAAACRTQSLCSSRPRASLTRYSSHHQVLSNCRWLLLLSLVAVCQCRIVAAMRNRKCLNIKRATDRKHTYCPRTSHNTIPWRTAWRKRQPAFYYLRRTHWAVVLKIFSTFLWNMIHTHNTPNPQVDNAAPLGRYSRHHGRSHQE